MTMTRLERSRPWLAALILAASLTFDRAGAAEPFRVPGQWTPRVEGLAATLKERPATALAPADPATAAQAALGAVLFRSPYVLGPVARRMGLSCDACHSNGAANGAFFLDGLSGRPGTVDLTSAPFGAGADDGKVDPLAIPNLHGVARTAPYGHDGAIPTLRAFVRHVVVDEFAGDEPSAAVLDALDAYLGRLDFPANRLIDAQGRLTAAAPADARRGEALFERPFPRDAALSCAGCHTPAAGFTDRRRHDVGTGGEFDTPSLRNSASAAALFHDGRAATLDEAVAHFDRFFALGLDARQRADLVAYLTAIGAADRPTEPVTLAGDLKRHEEGVAALGTALRQRDAALADLVAATLRLDLGAIAERFDGPDQAPARAALAAWSRALGEIDDEAASGRFEAAEAALARYRVALPAGAATLIAAAPASLYDAARLERFLAVRDEAK
jgi:cytochrome c peroxidase